MPIRNNLKIIMAKRGVNSISELHRKKHLKEFDYNTIRNFAIGMHRRLDSELIEAICKDLECDIEQLLYIEKKEIEEKEVV